MSLQVNSLAEDIKIYPPEDPEFIPVTISRNYLKIKTLKQEYQYSDTYQAAINTLSQNFAGWKRTRGDGNCYYRSVIASYVIKILHPYRNNLELEKFINIMKNSLKSPHIDDLRDSVEKMIEKFTKILMTRKTKQQKIEHFKEIHHSLQNKNFDTDLIYTSRAIALSTLSIQEYEYIINVFMVDGIDFTINNVSTFGNEAEGIELKMLPVGLDIKVVQYNNDGAAKFMVNEFYNDSVEKDYLKINIICKTRGHYDSLYSVKDLEEDGFNFAARCYTLFRAKILDEY